MAIAARQKLRIFMAILAPALLIFGLLMDIQGPARIYFSPFIMQFFVGVIVWRYRPQGECRFYAAKHVGIVGVLCALEVGVAPMLSGLLPDPNLARVCLYTLPAAALVMLSLSPEPEKAGLPRGRASEGLFDLLLGWLSRAWDSLGRQSYSLYLSHMFVVYGLLALFPVQQRTATGEIALLIGGLCASSALASLSHRFIETRFTRTNKA